MLIWWELVVMHYSTKFRVILWSYKLSSCLNSGGDWLISMISNLCICYTVWHDATNTRCRVYTSGQVWNEIHPIIIHYHKLLRIFHIHLRHLILHFEWGSLSLEIWILISWDVCLSTLTEDLVIPLHWSSPKLTINTCWLVFPRIS